VTANKVSDGNAAHESNAEMMEMTKAIENIFPQETKLCTRECTSKAPMDSFFF
jgi:hypothetical protein